MTVTLDDLAHDVAPMVAAALDRAGVRPVGHHWYLIADGGRPLTVNKARTLHHLAWAKRNEATRLVWWHLATHHRIPRLDAARIVVVPLHANHATPQDVAACAPAAKAAVDGLVDAGVLIDDDPAHLRMVAFLPPVVAGVNGLGLMVEDVG